MSKLFTITTGLENMGAIKTGGQGSVYKGRRIGEIITAIKLLPTPIFSQNEEDKHYRDFSNEVAKLKRVGEEPNPNIVKILSSGVSETGCFPYIEMEFIDGPDLGELLKPPHFPVFTIKEIIKVADQLSNALAHCHKLEVKHGDIKSNNVKYNQQTGNYVLLDFGLAILSDEERRTSLRRAGAIEFMAPEQNEGRMLFETDVYSFGIILYELLTGEVPFPLDGNSETARNKVMIAHMETPPPDLLSLRKKALPQDWTEEQKAWEMQVPEWVTSLVYKCLEKSPEDRFENGVELHDHISHHHIHTAEVLGLVKNEDAKWRAILTKKEAELEKKEEELEEMKAMLASQEKELKTLRRGTSAPLATSDYSEKKMVPRSVFTAVLIAAILVGGLAIYSLFFNQSVVGAAQTGSSVYTQDSSSLDNEENGSQSSENNSTAKKITKEERKAALDSIAALQPVVENKEGTTVQNTTEDSLNKEEAKPADTIADKTNENEKEKNEGVRYKVRNKAYFHDEPDASTKRDAFIIHWNNAVLKPLDEKAGFIYVIFTNHLGQTSKGWLSKNDLNEVK
jgi:serine/threonine protein kinase